MIYLDTNEALQIEVPQKIKCFYLSPDSIILNNAIKNELSLRIFSVIAWVDIRSIVIRIIDICFYIHDDFF